MNISLFYPSVVVFFFWSFFPLTFLVDTEQFYFLSLISLQHKLLSCEELCIEPKMTICLLFYFFFFFLRSTIFLQPNVQLQKVSNPFVAEVIFMVACGSLGYTV